MIAGIAFAIATLGALLLKLIFLPGCAVLLFISFGLHPADFLPAIILLSSPTATIVYVMAREMHGDGEFAVAAITASTLFAAATFTLWLALVAHLAR